MLPFDLDDFIRVHVTGRRESLFSCDIETHRPLLQSHIEGRSALIIGGAGSIGSAFIKAMLPYHLDRLYVIDTNENGLAELTRDLRSSLSIRVPDEYRTYPLSFGDPVFAHILMREGPFDIVANFAAHKHVRSEKDAYSVAAMLENNVLRNHRLLDLLADQPPQHFFCVSTDKATNPVNVMGASKKLMEELLLAYADALPVVTARFANVAFSQGSLLDGFLHRLAKRQPLSAPRDVRRYFVSPQESGELCLLASILGHPGEIFFPRLAAEEMKTFSEIADRLLYASGFVPVLCDNEEKAKTIASSLKASDTHWPVHYFATDTSGEKLFEEFYPSHESPDFSRFDAIGVLPHRRPFTREQIVAVLEEMQVLLANQSYDKSRLVAFLYRAVPDFHHAATDKHLDDRM